MINVSVMMVGHRRIVIKVWSSVRFLLLISNKYKWCNFPGQSGCSSRPCLHNSTCEILVGVNPASAYRCHCRSGYTGRNCEVGKRIKHFQIFIYCLFEKTKFSAGHFLWTNPMCSWSMFQNRFLYRNMSLWWSLEWNWLFGKTFAFQNTSIYSHNKTNDNNQKSNSKWSTWLSQLVEC
jgi:hypothetical protein